MASVEGTFKHVVVIRVLFAVPQHASYCLETLSVDDELQPDKASKKFVADGCTLVATLSASEPRLLRIVSSSFFDAISVVTQVLSAFGEPAI